MKALYKIAILCSVLSVLAACDKGKVIPPAPDNPLPQKEEVAPETHTLTFVLPEDGAKEAWVAGDKIVVHGEYAADQVVVTLETGDINGKTATKTVDGLKPYRRDDCTSNLYASYPAEAVDNTASSTASSPPPASRLWLRATRAIPSSSRTFWAS